VAKHTGAKGQGTDPTFVITVLSVSPADDDHSVLRDFFDAKAAAQPPLMIVTSRLADEYLWSEALHHGAYDVLSKPFDPDELNRVLTLASLKWMHPHKDR
jgi:DNA-binding response OmpR family regulator